jgi:hypothetical protein
MKNAIYNTFILYLEFKASRLRPAITKYLYGQKEYWKTALNKFHAGDKVTRDFTREEDILKNIENIEDELSFDNKYQLLKLKYRADKSLFVSIAREYLVYWSCLDFFRLTNNLNVTDPTYANTAIQFGSKKTEIKSKFENLLKR